MSPGRIFRAPRMLSLPEAQEAAGGENLARLFRKTDTVQYPSLPPLREAQNALPASIW